jgi:prepilin-type N-terminal cleavage/methylation domain-containing protein
MKLKNGFTLVELLIVISLIAILSVAVIATINPVEQANKARDAQYKNDAAEILNAYNRYNVSTGTYPWPDSYSISSAIQSNDTTFGSFGVLGIGGSKGVLISSGELKESFANKTPFSTNPQAGDQMYTLRNSSGVISVCFVPKSKINRQSPDLKCIGVNMNVGGPVSIGYSYLMFTCGALSSDNWNIVGNLSIDPRRANLMCVSN